MSITIRTSANSLAFALRNGERDTDIVYEPYPTKPGMALAANLRQAFADSPLLAMGHKRAVVLVDTPAMLIPTEEFDEQTAPRLYHLVNTRHEADDVACTELPELNAVAAYAVGRDLQVVLRDHFSDVSITPLMLHVWGRFFAESHDTLHRRLFCYMHDGKIDLTAFRRDRFCFSSSFAVTLAEDAVYFVLNAWKQLAMRQDADILVVAGTMPGKDKMLGELGKFISNIVRLDDNATDGGEQHAHQVELPFDLQQFYNNQI